MQKKTKKTDEEAVKFTGVKTDSMERATEKRGKVEIASFIMTIISTLYTIVTVIMFVSKKWVPSGFSGALIALLVIWIVAFVVIIALALSNRDAEKGQKALKIYKKAIKIFKSFVNVMFVAITVVSFAGVAREGIDGLVQWLVMSFTLVVAVVQLALKLAIIVMKLVFTHKGKGKSVEVVTYVNGEKRENKVQSKFLQKLYHTEDD